jgi:hypothetical protein
LPCQPDIPTLIMPNALLKVMGGAIDLDRKASRSAVEVEHIWSDRMLPAKP